jgi:hypothetical protein
MKYSLIILAGILASWSSCEKTVEKDGTIRGKLVHRSCASIVVQVLDPEYYGIGQNEWKQSPQKPTYEHVFNVENTCSFPQMNVGDEFTFKLTDQVDNNCAVCMMWDNPPAKKNRIEVVSINK